MKRSFPYTIACIILTATAVQAEVITPLNIGHDVAPGTAEAIYNRVTGEVIFNVGQSIGVVAIGNLDYATVIYPEKVDTDCIFGVPAQSNHWSVAYFSASGLPVGEDSIGFVAYPGLTQENIDFLYVPLGSEQVLMPVTIIPEPSTITMILVALVPLGAIGRRRGG